MANQRQYESATVFTARCVDMRHLWAPSTEYKGKPQDKPSWFSAFIVPKTVSQWHTEPALQGITQALMKIHANNPHVMDWPISDGDLPNREGKKSDWAAGHWVFGASTSQQPKVEMVQAGGSLIPLLQRGVAVKPGDYCTLAVTAAVKQNDARAAKLYLNTVVFTAPGQEIVFSSAPSGSELMAQAHAQGMQVAGFGAPSGGGFGAPAPQQFGAQPGGPFVGGQGTGTFAPHQNMQGATGGFAPQPAGGAMVSHSNPQPGQFGGPAPAGTPVAGQFGGPAPAGFGAPPNFAPNPQQQFGAQPGFGGHQTFAPPQGGPFGQ